MDPFEDFQDRLRNIRIGEPFELLMKTRNLRGNEQKPICGGTIPIRKIYVGKVPITYGFRGLWSIFSEYGEVVDVLIPHKRKTENTRPRIRTKYAFITFRTVDAAKKALDNRAALSARHSMIVHPADQWHQPLELPNGQIQWNRRGGSSHRSYDVMQGYESVGVGSSSDTETQPTLNMLNDDCLAHVFSFLSKCDWIGIERVCKRWRQLSLNMWRRVTSLDFKRGFVLKTQTQLRTDFLREVLLRCGNHLTNLDLSHNVEDLDSARAVRIVGKHCKVLRDLNIAYFNIDKKMMLCFEQLGKQLRSLTLDCCPNLQDGLMDTLMRLVPGLEHLSISRNPLRGVKWSLPAGLKSLNIDYCYHLKREDVSRILRNLHHLEKFSTHSLEIVHYLDLATIADTIVQWSSPKSTFFIPFGKQVVFSKLKVLDISFCNSMGNNMLANLVECCPALERLDISGCGESFLSEPLSRNAVTDAGVRELSKLKRLSCLHMSYLRLITSEALECLACNCNRSLRQLECRELPLLTDSGPSRLVALCPQLNMLDVSFCTSITEKLVLSAVESVKLRTNNQRLTMKMKGLVIEEKEEFKHPLLHIKLTPHCSMSDSGSSSLSDFDEEDEDLQMLFDNLDMIPPGVEGFYDWYDLDDHLNNWGYNFDYGDSDDWIDDDDDDDDDDIYEVGCWLD